MTATEIRGIAMLMLLVFKFVFSQFLNKDNFCVALMMLSGVFFQ